MDLLPELANAFNGEQVHVFIWYGTFSQAAYLKVPGEFIFDSINKDSATILITSHWKYRNNKKEFTLFSENIALSKDSITFKKLTFPQECAHNKHALNKKCPKCKRTDKVISILYGDRIPIVDKYGNILDPDPKEYYPGDTHGGNCSPTWYCKRDKLSF